MPTGKSRGARLARARGKTGLSQGQLADRVGVAKSTIANIERGTARPGVDLALSIGHELGQSVEALFGGGQ